MNPIDISELQSVREYPSVSILLPTYRKSPEELQQNPVRVKNLVRQAVDRLLGEFSKRDIQPLLEQLDSLTEQIDYDHPQDGLAIFANKNIGRLVYLSFQLRERVVIDETFATRNLVHARNRSKRYRVLALSQEHARLFEAERGNLTEVTTDGFPMKPEADGVETEQDSTFGVDQSQYTTRQDRLFFQQVEHALEKVIAKEPLPLVLAGVERNISFFNEVTKCKEHVIGTLNGSHDRDSARDLAALAWPVAREGFLGRRRQMLEQLDTSIGAKRYAAGINNCWRMAREGRGDLLLVEEDFQYPAVQDEASRNFMPAEDTTLPNTISDAVDEIVEEILGKSGRVVFVESGALDTHDRIALTLRY